MAPPAGLPSGASQQNQSPAPLARPGPLFTTARPRPKPRHTTFKTVKIHTAKCDVCNHHNTSTLARCIDCGWQICTPCLADRGGNAGHSGRGPPIPRPTVNPTAARVNPSTNVPQLAPIASVNSAPSNIQGPASNAQGSGGHISSPAPTFPATPVVINTSPAPALTAPNVPPPLNPVACAPTTRASAIPAPARPALANRPANTAIHAHTAQAMHSPMATAVADAKNSNEIQRQKENEKGKANVRTPENNFEEGMSEGCGKKWTLRPRGVVNYYPEPVSVEDTDNGKGTAVEGTYDSSGESEGGDIPYDAWKGTPKWQRFDGPLHFYRPQPAARTPTQMANQPLQTRPPFETNIDSGANGSIESLLYAAEDALKNLGKKISEGNRSESSNAARPSMPRAAMQPLVSNQQQAPAQLANASSTSSLNKKRKRTVPSTLRPAKTQGYGFKTGYTKFKVYTDPRGQASTSHAEPGPEANESSNSSAETDPEARMDIDEDQPLGNEETPTEPPIATGSGATTKAAVNPRLQNLYRDALRVKDRNGKLKRIDKRGPKA